MASRLVLAVVALALLLPAAPASATSCIIPAPLPRLQAADGAIVGEALARGDDGAIRFAVRERIKGQVGQVIELPGDEGVQTNSDLGYLPQGTITGLYLRRDAQGWHAGVCDQVAPRALRDAARAARAGQRCRLPSVGTVDVVKRGRHVRLVVRVLDPDGRPSQVDVSFGDGVSERRSVAPRGQHSGVVAFGHRFRRARTYVVTLRTFARPRPVCGQVEDSARRKLSISVN